MESSLDTRLHSNKVLHNSSSVSSEEDDEDEPSHNLLQLLDKKTGLPSKPGCYEEQLMMMVVEQGRTSAVRPGSSAQSHLHFLTLFLSPTTSPSSNCHHQNENDHSPPLNHHHHHHNHLLHHQSDSNLSKICIPNKRRSKNSIHDDHRLRRFRLREIPTMKIPNRQLMTSF